MVCSRVAEYRRMKIEVSCPIQTRSISHQILALKEERVTGVALLSRLFWHAFDVWSNELILKSRVCL